MGRSAERRGGRRLALGLVVVGLAVAGGLAWRYRDALLESGAAYFASPATQVRKALAQLDGLTLDLGGGGRVALAEVRFADVATQVSGDRVEVISMVEGRGGVDWRGQRIDLGYVGREAFTMVRCSTGGWCSEGVMLPALGGILVALEARAEGAAQRVRAWQVRVERDRATAGEDLAQEGAGADGPRRELHELRRRDGRWEIVGDR